MRLYAFNLCRPDGLSTQIVTQEMAKDREALDFAEQLLDLHLSCDYVEIWDGDHPIVSRHRFQPVI